MTRDDQVSNADLHALADGQLPEPRRSEVEAYLETHPEAAHTVAEYRRLNQSLHALYDPVLNEGVPPELSRSAKPLTAARLMPRAAIAAGLVLFGGIVGWTLNSQLRAPQPAPLMVELIRPAAFAHAVYVPEVRHPVEVTADAQAHLVSWLSKRLQTPIRAPDLQAEGFELMGGRLLPSTGRMAAQFMYQDGAGNRVTLYFRKVDWDSGDTAFHYAHEKGIGVFFWVDGSLGYALSGELSRDRLLQLANAVYRYLNP